MNRVLRERTGSLLVVTLWVVTILATLAVAVGRYLSLEVRLTTYHVARAQAQLLARSGVYLAMQRVMRDAGEGVDWREDDWAFEASKPWVVLVGAAPAEPSQPQDRVEITVTDEERKLDLNSPSATLPALTMLLGNAEVARAIMEYHAPAKNPPQPDGEDQPAVPYYAKHDRVNVVEELWDIPIVRQVAQDDPHVLLALLQETTVHTQGKVNVNTASEAVLDALELGTVAEVTPDLIQTFVRLRGVGSDEALGGGDDCLSATDLTALKACLAGFGDEAVSNLVAGLPHESAVFRVVATGIIVRPAVRYRVEAVVQRSGCPQDTPAPCILAWKEG